MRPRLEQRQLSLAVLAAGPGVSLGAVARILATVGQASEARVDRHAVRRAVRNQLPDTGPNGALFISLQIGAEKVRLVSPSAVVSLLASDCERFWAHLQAAAAAAAAEGGDGLCGLVLYSDVATGGNVLSSSKTRECENLLWSIAEFGELLGHVEYWMPIGYIQTKQEERLDGKLSTLFSAVLTELFFVGGRNTFDTRVYGPRGETLDLRLKMHGVIPDESAMQSLKSTKGASGRKPCHKCSNVTLTSQNLGGRGSGIEDLNCTSVARLRPYTDVMLFDAWDRMAAMAAQGQNFKEFEKDIGYVYHPRAVLALPALRGIVSPSKHFFDDPCHTYLASNGIACSELIELEAAAIADNPNINTGSLQQLASQRWRLPGGARGAGQWFERRRMESSRAAGYYKGRGPIIFSGKSIHLSLSLSLSFSLSLSLYV